MNSFLKVSIFALLVMLTVSIGFAAEVTDDTNDITIQNTETIEETTTEVVDTNNAEQESQINSYNPITTDTIINDNTWDNQVYDVSSNVKITSSVSQSNNIAFRLNGNNITIDGLNIVNDETQPIVINALPNSNHISIINTNITVVNTEETKTMAIILNNTQNSLVEHCNVNFSAVSQPLYIYNETTENYDYFFNTSAILTDGGNNITINANTVHICNSTSNGSFSGTGEVITVRFDANNVNVINNNVTGEGFPYVYGINIYGVSNLVLIENNTVNLTSGNYIGGIQLTSTSNSIIRRNTITGTCFAESGQCAGFEASAYGIVLSSSYKPTASESTNNLIEYNDIDLSANVTYGIELNIADNTRVFNNTVDVDGDVVMALGIYNSSYCQIKDNTFTVTGQTRELHPYFYEAIPPVTTGIKIVSDDNKTSEYNIITGNRINVQDTNNTNLYSIILENNVNNNTVNYNFIRAGNKRNINDMILNNGIDNIVTPNYRLT